MPLVPRRLRAVLAAALCVLSVAGCTASRHAYDGDDVIVQRGVGGYAKPIFERYAAYVRAGRRIVVDGQVASADAFGAFAMPDMCYTHNAVWSPHMVSRHFTEPDPEGTRLFASYLPEPLERFFLNHPSSRDPVGVPRIRYDQLARLWPEGSCEPVEVGLARFHAAGRQEAWR